MSSMLLKSTSVLMLAGVLTAVPSSLRANNFEYFSKGVDYWNELKTVPEVSATKVAPTTKTEPGPAVKAETSGEPFSWEKHLDPKNKDFFREGDYTPPEPFMELVRNPSDENLKMWFAYVDRKNELATRLNERMSEYLTAHGTTVPVEQKKVIADLSARRSGTLDPKRYRLRVYFSSTCPHCQKMFGTLTDLQSRGFFIEARQLDRTKGSPMALPFSVEFASPQEAQQKNVQSVPLLLIGDLKRKVVYRLSGYQTVDAVIDAIRKQDSGI